MNKRSAKEVLEGLTKKDWEIITLKATVAQQALMINHLDAENEALRKDAERYQWLREKQTFIWLIQDWFPSDAEFTDVAAEIDAAMSKEASHE